MEIYRYLAYGTEFPESLVSDSKHRVSRFRTRLNLGIGSVAVSSLGLGIGSVAVGSLGLGLEVYNILELVSESKLIFYKASEPDSELNIYR